MRQPLITRWRGSAGYVRLPSLAGVGVVHCRATDKITVCGPIGSFDSLFHNLLARPRLEVLTFLAERMQMCDQGIMVGNCIRWGATFNQQFPAPNQLLTDFVDDLCQKDIAVTVLRDKCFGLRPDG